jgi:NADH-quinone oxidoreductase subunit M
LLSTFILIISYLAAWNLTVNALLFSSLILLIEIFLIGSFASSSIFTFLVFFEASAIPIFIMIIYCGSPRRERIKAGYYFILFTLYGSMSLLLIIINFYVISKISLFNNYGANDLEFLSWILLFISFAIKVPLFPFHIWLPYAHVEASTSTSILLASLMLKLGGFGIIKFMLPLFLMEVNLFFRPVALFVCIFGISYGALCALRQIDLKRQIAFSSISHMSFAMAGVFTYSEVGIKGGLYLMVSHGLSSAGLFFLVGALSDRYHTRSIIAYSGLLSVMPIFSFFFLFMTLVNVGFPGTSGFPPEFIVLTSLVGVGGWIVLPTLLGMLLGTAGSILLALRLLFGSIKDSFALSFTDFNFLEFFICSVLSTIILLLGFKGF